MDESISTILSRYYDSAADDYRQSIETAFIPLARSLVQAANISHTAKVLDLGCGTGAVERAVRATGALTVCLDFSKEMTRISLLEGAEYVVNGNIHQIPTADAQFDIIVSNFAFNHTAPASAFAESYRVLSRNGWLWFQEWGERDQVSDLVSEIFVEYMVDDPSRELDRFRDQLVMDLPWDDLETTEDIMTLLVATGFQEVESDTLNLDVHFESVSSYLDYKLAWPARKAELAAMPPDVRNLCRADLEENLQQFVLPDNRLRWSPQVYRFRAQKG